MFFCIRHELCGRCKLRGTYSSKDEKVYFIALDVARIAKIAYPKRYVLDNAHLQIQDLMGKRELNLRASIHQIRVLSMEMTVALLSEERSGFCANRLARALAGSETMVLRTDNGLLIPEDLDLNVKNAIQVTITLQAEEKDQIVDNLCNFLNDFKFTCLEFYNQIELSNKISAKEKEMHIFQPELGKLELNAPPRFLNVHFGDEIFKYILL